MSTIPTVTPYWLGLRGAADDAARSVKLADAAARLVGDGPAIVHDLGSGSGAMMRWLAPRLPVPQKWVLRDADPAILALGSRREGLPHLPIVVTTIVEELADLPLDAFAGASLVTASALLDVITPTDALRIVAACVESATPAFFSLSVAGVVRFTPADAADARIQAAFNDHQRRERDGQRLLGPHATDALRELFIAAGWRVREAATPWRLGAADRDLITEWLYGWLDAAVEQAPALREEAHRFRELRLKQLDDGLLGVEVRHRDLLAWPK